MLSSFQDTGRKSAPIWDFTDFVAKKNPNGNITEPHNSFEASALKCHMSLPFMFEWARQVTWPNLMSVGGAIIFL